MNGIVYNIIVLFLSIWEVWMAYYFIEGILFAREDVGNIYIIINWGVIVGIGSLLTINRSQAFFSWGILLICVVLTSVCVRWIVKEKFRIVLGVISLYYILISLMDFVFAYVCIEYLGTEFQKIIYMETYSVFALGIYALSRSLIYALLMKVRKSSIESIQWILYKYKNMLLVISVIIFLFMIRCQIILNDMAFGYSKIQGVDKAIMLAVMLVVVFGGGVLFLQYAIKNKEIEFLKFQDGLLQERVLEMLQTRQIAHDIKNHIVVMKKFDESGESEELHSYIKELYKELTEHEIQVWTGIEIVDYLLTQKLKRAEQENIKVVVDAGKIDRLPFSNPEIVSILGNLLDNAVEACERVSNKERWIDFEIQKKNGIFFLKITNSMEMIPEKGKTHLFSMKKERELHGYGLNNVRRIVEKYNGEMYCATEEGMFSVTILLYKEGGN